MRLALAAATLALALPAGVVAEDRPVVVELFTSQGCASCPPADALLGELAQYDEVLPLSLHVDYWDYIGWRDPYADPAFSARQKAYAKSAGRRMIFTPQVIVDGSSSAIGSKAMKIAQLIETHREQSDPIEVDVRTGDDGLHISVAPRGAAIEGPLVVHLVRFSRHERDVITRGENAGHTLDYFNVVKEWTVLGEWDGTERLSLTAEVGADGAGEAAILVQKPGPGEIVGAARLP